MKHKNLKIYFDKNFAGGGTFQGRAISNDEDIYIGRGTQNNRIGIESSGFDNMQIFNKALTIEEITILALANKDAITD